MDEYADIIAETAAQDGTEFRVILVPDQDAQNPREEYGTHAGVIWVLRQPSHNVPQELPRSHRLAWDLEDAIQDHDFRVVARWLRVFHGATVVLPIYATRYDSAITAGTADEAPTAGNYVGITFDTPDSRKECGFGPRDTVLIGAALAADVAQYAAWAEGEVYGYVVETGPGADDVEIPDSSCWGFIGREWAEETARDALEQAVSAYDEQTDEDEAELFEVAVVESGGRLG